MKRFYNRSDLAAKRELAWSSPEALLQYVPDSTLPDELADWLVSLALLKGVPFNYLVPDEGMLPAESIRFFYLDPNWVDALLDGAMSIGSNLASGGSADSTVLLAALSPSVKEQVRSRLTQARAKAFGLTATETEADTITGFLLRSSLVLDYPDMGLYAYAYGHTPDDEDPESLDVLRWEQLGTTSDTLICMVAGNGYRYDIHEAPQALHYGIDCFDDECTVEGITATAVKNIHTFGNTTSTVTENGVTYTTNTVTMSESATPTDISSCFRPISPRVLSMSALAEVILATNQAVGPPSGTTAPTTIDSAEMGFEMTQGMGLVTFYNSNEESTS